MPGYQSEEELGGFGRTAAEGTAEEFLVIPRLERKVALHFTEKLQWGEKHVKD